MEKETGALVAFIAALPRLRLPLIRCMVKHPMNCANHKDGSPCHCKEKTAQTPESVHQKVDPAHLKRTLEDLTKANDGQNQEGFVGSSLEQAKCAYCDINIKLEKHDPVLFEQHLHGHEGAEKLSHDVRVYMPKAGNGEPWCFRCQSIPTDACHKERHPLAKERPFGWIDTPIPKLNDELFLLEKRLRKDFGAPCEKFQVGCANCDVWLAFITIAERYQ